MSKNGRKKIGFLAVFLTLVMYVVVFQTGILETFKNTKERIGTSTLITGTETIYVVTLKYMYQNGTLAQSRDVYVYSPDETISLDIPQISGYTSNIDEIDEVADDGLIDRLSQLDYVEVIQQDGYNIYSIYYTITYVPAASSYTVEHYLENIDGTYTKYYSELVSDNVYIGDTATADIVEYEGFTYSSDLSVSTSTVVQDGSTTLSLYYERNSNYIYLDSDGGTYYEPVAVKYGDTIDLSSYVPVRDGYTFTGWTCIDKTTGNTIATPSTMPNNDVYFVAQWEAGTTSFSITYFIENADDDNYTNSGTYIVTGITSGTVISDITNIQDLIDAGFSTIKSGEEDYFTYDSTQGSSFDIEVEGDGTTNINVFYSRNEYTIVFMAGRTSGTTYQVATVTSGSEDANTYTSVTAASTIVVNGTTYTNTYTLTAKYEADISKLWPTVTNVADRTGTNGYTYYFVSWGTSSSSEYWSTHTNKNILGIYPTMSAELIIDATDTTTVHTMYGYWSTSPKYFTYHYMFESLDQTTSTENTVTYGTKYYEEDSSATVRSTNTSANQNAQAFYGYTLVDKTYTSSSGGSSSSPTDIYFYYDRNEYTLTLYNVNGTYVPSDLDEELNDYGIYLENGEIIVKYGANISALENLYLEWEEEESNTFEYPITTSETAEYTFDAWYQDSTYEYIFDWSDTSETTVTSNLVLYASWETPEYTITFDTNGGDWTETNTNYIYSDGVYTLVVDSGETLEKPQSPTREGYTFLGWYYTNSSGETVEYIFSSSQAVYSDIELVAQWEAKADGEYTVKYVLAEYDSDGNLITDISQYTNVTYLLADKTVTDLQYGTTVSEDAEYIEYSGGVYLVDEYEKSLVISTDNDSNVIYFFYTPQASVEYTVYYVLDTGVEYANGEVPDSSVLLAETKTVEIDDQDTIFVTESSIEIDGYEVDAYKKSTVLVTTTSTVDATQNAIYFYYSPVENQGNYIINYYFMDENGEYPDDPDYVVEDEDSVGKYIYASDYATYLSLDNPLYIGHELDEEMSNVLMIVISSGDTAVLNIYFKNITYTVTYDTQGGVWQDTDTDTYTELTEETYIEEVTYSQTATEPEDPTKDGYRFLGWYTDEDELYDFTAGVYENTTLYAKWMEQTSITVEKVWDDENDKDGYRTNQVVVYAQVDGVTQATYTISENDSWQIAIDDLDVYDENGDKIDYDIVEAEVSEYTTDYNYDTATDTWTITNTHVVEKKDITITKVWDDNDDQDGLRPENLIVNLKVGGVTYTSVTLNESNLWSETIEDLDVYDNGVKIEYSVDEELVEDYTTNVEETASGFTITNTHTPETTSLNVKKTWDDNDNQDGKRTDSVTVYLVADGVVSQSATLDDTNDWAYTFSDIAKNSAGSQIEYTISEAEVTDYTYTTSYDENTNTWTVTNVHTPETVDITVDKIWDDDSNRDGIRPTSVTVNLTLDGAVIDTATVDESTTWSTVFEDLPKYKDGVLLNYGIEEITVTGYTTNISTLDGYSYTVTNTHTPETKDIVVTKIWRDGSDKDGLRPDSIDFILYKDGVDYSGTITLDSTYSNGDYNEWVYTFNDLYVYENGEEIDYSAREVEVPEEYGVIYKEDGNNLYIYNVYPPEVEITVEKVWDDEDDADGIRPSSIYVQLQANGSDYTLAGENVGYVELNDANDWTYTWEYVEKYDDNGDKYEYTLEEVTTGNSSYTTTVALKDSDNPEYQFTYVVTNSYVPQKTNITVTKVWEDNSNQDGIRPDSVTVRLYANGTEIESATVSESDLWTYTFENVNVNEAGTPIIYTVSEDSVAGYSTGIVDNQDGTFTVTNTHTPETTSLTVKKVWDDNDNQDGIRPDTATVMLLANGSEVDTYEFSDTAGWETTVNNLPVYADGQKIEYTLYEEAATGYTPAYSYDDTTLTVTNTHTPETITYTITKEWDDDDDRDGLRPTNVILTLKADGNAIKDNIILNQTGGWTYEVEDLPKYSEGTLIVYTVEEETVANYRTSYTYDTDANTAKVTNTHTPETTSINITKEWEDNDNYYNNRPDTLLVDIYADDELIQTVELEEAYNYEITVGGLYVKDSGKTITYSVKEQEYAQYETIVSTDDNYTFKITNTLITYNITTDVNGTGGTISGDNLDPYETVPYSGDNTKDIVITPDEGYYISSITINGDEQTLPQDPTVEYTLPQITNITEDKEVIVTFERITCDITTEVTSGQGTISGESDDPYETVYYGEDSTKEIVITPDTGWEISKITINGEEQTLPADPTVAYTLSTITNITEDTVVAVEFVRSVVDLNVTNTVTGNLGEIDKEFTYTVEIINSDLTTYDEDLTYYVTDENGNIIESGTITDGTLEVVVKHGQSLTIEDIPEFSIYTITQTNGDDYTTTIDGTIVANKTTTGTLTQNTTIEYVNEKEYIAPTGVTMTIMPFAIGIVLVAGLYTIVKNSRKKKLVKVNQINTNTTRSRRGSRL